MKALLKSEPMPGAKLLEEVDRPSIGEKDVLVEVQSTAVCGTDIHIYDWTQFAKERVQIPRIFGHEFCGKVVKVGNEVKAIDEGDLITGETHIPCGICKPCRTGYQHICKDLKILGLDIDGSFAEYIRVPEPCAWKLPRDFSPEVGAIMEPVGGAVHATMTPSVNLSKVLITGAGPIGLASVIIANFIGATEIIVSDLSSERLKLAGRLGATVTLNPKHEKVSDIIMDLTHGSGIDVFIEMSGNPKALKDGLKALGRKGEVVLFGLPSEEISIDIANRVIFNESILYGVTGRKMYETWYQVTSLIEKGLDFSSIITHKFNLEDYKEAFEVAKSREGGKILFEV